VRFLPDPDIFKTTTTFEFDRVSGRLDELAYLNAGISISLEDKRCVCLWVVWLMD
jgi:DNA gyrase subunit B